ncbi:hypothetical protein CSPAE12_08320 [Colletotrichum incanum]|nr:hypothetical protein CSPAE12_08320 [Colletotrichum incanum]
MPFRSIQVSPNTYLISFPLRVPPRSSPKSRELPMPDCDSSIALPPFPVFYALAHSLRPASPSKCVTRSGPGRRLPSPQDIGTTNLASPTASI